MKDVSYDILDLMDEYGEDEAGLLRILETQQEPAVLYALSKIRENLVDWIEFPRDGEILLIGADYGALVGSIAARAGRVTVVDERDENLMVSKRRHQSLTNIDYRRGGISELAGMEADGVVLVGPKNDKTLVEQAAGLLKPGGKMILALNNSASVRVFAGDRPDPEVMACRKPELRFMLDQLPVRGTYTLYYPLPDFWLPAAIYSDAFLPAKGELPNLYAEYRKPRFRLFSEEAALGEFSERSAFTEFTNSFLVIWERA